MEEALEEECLDSSEKEAALSMMWVVFFMLNLTLCLLLLAAAGTTSLSISDNFPSLLDLLINQGICYISY